MYTYAVVTFFDGNIDHIECVCGQKKEQTYFQAQQIMVQNFINEALEVFSPQDLLDIVRHYDVASNDYGDDDAGRWFLIYDDSICVENHEYTITTYILKKVTVTTDFQHRELFNTATQKRVYAIRNKFTGELFFNARGGTYKAWDDAANKLFRLTEEHGDLFEIVTYELKE